MKSKIILIVTDDQTVNTINSKGNSDIITPNLDLLCNDGTYFNNCYIHGGTSGAICMPSRAILNSSQKLFNLKDAGNVIPDSHPLLGEELIKQGYKTFFTGKWHNGIDAFKRSFIAGDNIFFGGMWDHYNVPMNKYDPEGKYDNKVDYVANFQHSNQVLTMHANKFNPGEHSTDVITKSAIEFINQVDLAEPFYLNAAYLAPHDPRVVPEKYIKLYDNKELSIPENFDFKHGFNFGQETERDEQLAPKPMNMEWYLNELKSYYAMISHLDAEIGKLIEALKQRDLYDESIIIFTSDNGLTLGSHGLMGKQNLYNESVNVPFIIKQPKNINIASKDCSQLITLQDIFPTILDLIDAEIPKEVCGSSFKACLQDPTFKVHDNIYLAFTEFVRAVQNEKYKLIKYRPKADVEYNQLFNVELDKFELNNLYDDKEYALERETMELLLLDLCEEYEQYNNHFTELFWSKYE